MRKKVTEQPAVMLQQAGRLIDQNAMFKLDELRPFLGVAKTTLRREARRGRLRVTRRAGVYWTRGSWLLEYFESGPGRTPGTGSGIASRRGSKKSDAVAEADTVAG